MKITVKKKILFVFSIIFILFIFAYRFNIGRADFSAPSTIETYPSSVPFSSPQYTTTDSAGFIYVTDSGSHLVRKFDGSTWTVFANSDQQGLYDPQGIAVFPHGDGHNTFYVSDLPSYYLNNGRILMYDDSAPAPSWTVIECPHADEDYHVCVPYGIAVDSSGVVYVADSANGVIRKYNGTWSVLSGWFSSEVGIAVDASTGDLYVAEGANGNRVMKSVDGGLNWTVFAGSDGIGLSYPWGITVAGGKVYVADKLNDRIEEYTGSEWVTWGSTGFEAGQFSGPSDIAIDSGGNMWVTDTANGRVQKYDGVTWTAYGGQFDGPIGVSVDSSENIYVADEGHNEIQKYSKESSTWSVLPSPTGGLSYLIGVTVDPSGNIYVIDSSTDTGNYRVMEYRVGSSDWILLPAPYDGSDENVYPQGIVADSSGNIYVVDTGSGGYGNVLVYDSTSETPSWTPMSSLPEICAADSWTWYCGIAADSSGNIYVVDSDYNAASVYDGEIWTALPEPTGGFIGPQAIAADSSGNVYVADTGNNRILKYPVGSTEATDWIAYGSLGVESGQFDQPSGIAVNSDGTSVYVADTYNNRIQQLDYSSDTSTPTPTETPTPVSNSSFSTPSAPTCDNAKPLSAPDLFQIDVNGSQARLFYAPVKGSNSDYIINYSNKPDTFQYGTTTGQGASTGVLSYMINHLEPNTVYYFRIRGQNGCMPGSWSNEMKIKTRSRGITTMTLYYKNILVNFTATVNRLVNPSTYNK